MSVAPPPSTLCESGHSEDPPHRELVLATRLFREQKYRETRERLDALAQKYPRSATVLALRGDATLFDESLAYEEAAREALRSYEPAVKLVEGGCEVPRRTEYYLWMGEAYAALRLHEPERAFSALTKAERKWPNSAEVHYNLARVRCGRLGKFGKNRADVAHDSNKRELDECVREFELALEFAESPTRPLFFRTHRSAEDWIVRSETQSELGPLRSDPRYARIIAAARARAALPSSGG